MKKASESLYPEGAILLAPLSGYTDLPFRRECRRFGCRYAFTPMVDACSLYYQSPKNKLILERGDDEDWLGVQLVGAHSDMIGKAAELLNEFDFEVLDMNMGCPMPKVTKKGAGAALSTDADRAVDCVRILKERSRFPVTAKIRIPDQEDPTPAIDLVRRLEDAGAQAVTIHGRVWKKIYGGPVFADIIRKCAESVEVPVIANGGGFDRKTVEELREGSGCSRIMLARGVLGNPFLFRELLEGNASRLYPSHEEICRSVDEQVSGMIAMYGEVLGMKNARKIILAYIVGKGYPRKRREEVSKLKSEAEFRGFMSVLREEGRSSDYELQIRREREGWQS